MTDEQHARLTWFAMTGDVRQWTGPAEDVTGAPAKMRDDLRALLAAYAEDAPALELKAERDEARGRAEVAEARLATLEAAVPQALLGADFAWGDPAIPVLVFALHKGARVSAAMSLDEIAALLGKPPA